MLVVAMSALFFAAMESWVYFVLFLVVIGLFWWQGRRRRELAGGAGADEVVVPRHEASRLLGGKSVAGLLIWGELTAAQLPSGEMGVTLSSVHREMRWQESASAAKRLWRLLSF
jgi:nicotinamide riboside transporter PnuC